MRAHHNKRSGQFKRAGYIWQTPIKEKKAYKSKMGRCPDCNRIRHVLISGVMGKHIPGDPFDEMGYYDPDVLKNTPPCTGVGKQPLTITSDPAKVEA